MTFEELFQRRTGRTPTPEEIREGLWFEDATKHGVDPMTLLYVADVAHADERKKAANEMRVAASEAAATIRAGLPTNPEWDKAAAWATILTRATKLQAAILGTTAAVALTFGLLIGIWTNDAMNAHADHLIICADTEQRVLQIADYAKRKLRLRTLARDIRALRWPDCP